MAGQQSVPLTKIERNNRIFAIIWIILEAFFCVMYGVYAHTTAFNITSTNGLSQYTSAVGIAIATVIGLGGIMTYVTGLKWSGFGFALLITVLCYQYYFLANAFWTKADIQRTDVQPSNQPDGTQQYYGNDFLMWVSQAFGVTFRTFGNTATGAFKMAMTITIAFSAVVGRAGPLEILIFVLFGGALYELNRQIIVQVNNDIGGSITIFMFGGIMGTISALLLAYTRQKDELNQRVNYTSSRFNSTLSIIGSAFFWVFYPLIMLDVPRVFSTTTTSTTPFLAENGMINAYWGISTCVVTSIAMSALLHGRIRIKDLMYGTFAGAAIIGTSAPHIFNTIAAILLGMIAGLIQPFFNWAEEKMAHGKATFSTCVPFVFGVQGLLGSLAAGILRAIQDNAIYYNYNLNPYPFIFQDAGEYYRATFISFGIAIGAGVIVGLLLLLVTGQETKDYFEDSAYWIYHDDGLRRRKDQPQVQEGDEIKGAHSYIGGN